MEPARKILHVDMDAFYASVEIRDNPALRGLPVVVGGQANTRGVVAAASYAARTFGIRSAMPMARAERLCPNLVIVPPNFEKYTAVSRQIRAIFLRYTDLVEPLSLDEAYLDVTENKQEIPSATWIAQGIRAAIHKETELTASAGVAPNKFLAKVASEQNKPDGLFVIKPEEVAAFIATLTIDKVPGIGRVTRQHFEALGIATCADLQRLSLAELVHHFGKRGSWFHDIARGIDHRPVEPDRVRKSVGIEDTFARDHDEPDWIADKLAELAKGLALRMERAGTRGRTLTLKARLSDFSTFTRSITPGPWLAQQAELLALAQKLFADAGFPGKRLRLLGLSLSGLESELEPAAWEQLELPLAQEGEAPAETAPQTHDPTESPREKHT